MKSTKVVVQNSMLRIARVSSVWLVSLVLCWAATAAAGPLEDLIKAASDGNADAVQALLAKGADIDAKDDLGRTALIVASEHGHLDAVQTLLAKGADVNAKANTGFTALMAACVMGHVDVLQATIPSSTIGS